MSAIDITVAITAHAETVMAGPTMRSVERAIQSAEAGGYRVERLLGFDTPTQACKAYFGQSSLSHWTKSEFAFRDQGKTRNALAKEAKGRWLAFLDADDLFSENWLVEAAGMLASAERAGDRVVVHPELNWFFEDLTSVLVSPGQDDPLFTPYYFCVANYYDALCMAPVAAFRETPYADRAVASGFAYEDWQWAIETMAAGWRHVVARDTIIFKRRREASQTLESSSRRTTIRSIEPMAIDRVGQLGKPVLTVEGKENRI